MTASRLEALVSCAGWEYLHELLFGALGADDVLSVGDEALAHERGLALRAYEAIVVPVTVFERDEAGAADAWNLTILFLVDLKRFFLIDLSFATKNCFIKII